MVFEFGLFGLIFMWVWVAYYVVFAFGWVVGCLVWWFRPGLSTSGKRLLISCALGFAFVDYLVDLVWWFGLYAAIC